jgi:hypothetical protein
MMTASYRAGAKPFFLPKTLRLAVGFDSNMVTFSEPLHSQ